MHVKTAARLVALTSAVTLSLLAPSATRAQAAPDSGAGGMTMPTDAGLNPPPVPKTYWALRYQLPSNLLPGAMLQDPTLSGPGGETFPASTVIGLALARGWNIGSKLSLEAEGIYRKLDLPKGVVGSSQKTVNGSGAFAAAFVNAMLEPVEMTGLPFIMALIPRVGGGLGMASLHESADGFGGGSSGMATQLFLGARILLDPRTSVSVDYRATATEKLSVKGVQVGSYASRGLELDLQLAI